MTEPRGPQERVLQRTMEPGPDLLVVPVLQMVDQLAEVVVDVPNIVSQSEFQLCTVEQFVNIPILDSGTSGFGLHGFLPGQSSSAAVEQIADISALVVFLELLKVFKDFSLDRVQQRVRSRSLTFKLLVEVFKVLPQDRIQRRLAEVHELPFLVEVLKTLSQDRVLQRFMEQNMIIYVSSQNRFQQRFAVLKELVKVLKIFSQFRFPRWCSEVEELVEVLMALTQDKVPLRPLAVFHLRGLCFASRSWRSSWRQWSALGFVWYQCLGPRGVYWWMSNTRYVQWQPPAGFTPVLDELLTCPLLCVMGLVVLSARCFVQFFSFWTRFTCSSLWCLVPMAR